MRWIVQAVATATTPNGQLVRQLPTFELPEMLGLRKHSSAVATARDILAPWHREGEEVSFNVTAAEAQPALWERYLEKAMSEASLPGGLMDLEDPWATARQVFLGSRHDSFGLIDDMARWMRLRFDHGGE